jgi:hypothetical protein
MNGTAFLDGSASPDWAPWMADSGLFAMPDDPPVKVPPPAGGGFDVPDGGDPSPKPSEPVKTSLNGFSIPDDSK